MRAVIQRVEKASVTVDEKITGIIGVGLLILLGIEEKDNQEDIEWLAAKVASLRIFSDEEGKMNLDIKETKGELLVVSQFTLHAITRKGSRPSFIRAARPEQAIPLYQGFIRELNRASGIKVESGIFGAMMKVELINDGPVTILVDTKQKE